HGPARAGPLVLVRRPALVTPGEPDRFQDRRTHDGAERMITKRHLLAVAGAASVAARLPARAQTIRTTTRMLVGFPPGGPVDIVARLLAAEMKDYAATIIIENRPGGGGRVALETLRTSAGDGSVLLLTPASMIVIFPHVYKTLSYSPLRDFAPVTTVCEFPL